MTKKRRRWLIILSIVLLFVIWVATMTALQKNKIARKNVPKPGALEVASATPEQKELCLQYLREKGQTPAEYVKTQFQRHDVILLGEMHEVREVCQFISGLMAPLYHEAGVHVFGMECLKYKNTAMANQLVTGATYDDSLALALFRDCTFPVWGFQEYADILKAVWTVNHDLPPGAPKMRVIGLEPNVDMYDIFCGHWWNKIDDYIKEAGNDRFMAKALSREVLEKNEKALVQVGFMHSFTQYRQPVAAKGRLVAEVMPRMGYILHERYGDRVSHIEFHHWDLLPDIEAGGVREPFGGFLEEVFAANDTLPVGFDVSNSPFALLRDSSSYFYTFQKYVTFNDLTDGYIFLKPLGEQHKIHWIPGFIYAGNFQKARGISLKKGWITEAQGRTPEQLDEALKREMEN